MQNALFVRFFQVWHWEATIGSQLWNPVVSWIGHRNIWRIPTIGVPQIILNCFILVLKPMVLGYLYHPFKNFTLFVYFFRILPARNFSFQHWQVQPCRFRFFPHVYTRQCPCVHGFGPCWSFLSMTPLLEIDRKYALWLVVWNILYFPIYWE